MWQRIQPEMHEYVVSVEFVSNAAREVHKEIIDFFQCSVSTPTYVGRVAQDWLDLRF